MPAKPSDKSLDDLISTLKKHIEPTPSILAKRFTFHCRSQGNLENIVGRKTLSFTTAVETAQSMESVDQQAKMMRGGKEESRSWKYKKFTHPAAMKV